MQGFISNEPDAQERLELLCARFQKKSKIAIEIINQRTQLFMEYFGEQIVNSVKSSCNTAEKSRIVNRNGFAHGLAEYIHPFVIRFLEEAEVANLDQPNEQFIENVYGMAKAKASMIAPSLAQELISIPITVNFDNKIAELCANKYHEFGINEIVIYPHPKLVHDK